MDDKLNVYHTPVLLKETIDLLFTKADGIYIDGTIGGGGHSEALLAKLSSGGKIFGFDKDPEAIEHCKEKFKSELEKGENSRIELFNECFSKACSITRHRGNGQVFCSIWGSRHGSSMRAAVAFRIARLVLWICAFSPHGRTAEDLVNAVDEEELAALLRKFGEEPFAKKIARRIVQQRKIAPIRTTVDLARIVESVVPRRSLASSLSRVFPSFKNCYQR
jgi:16S rRNA (cytosine1402-N4)-methyltransferase